MIAVKPFDKEKVEKISKSLNIPTPVSRVLSSRGIETPEDALKFLSPKLEHIDNPFLIPDMDRAVHRIKEAVIKKQNILIYGDYDADGITATSLLYRFLKNLGCKIYTYIPHRVKEGHGLSELVFPIIKKNSIDLMITVDCGVRDHDLVKSINSMGVDVIITDHHLPDLQLPAASAVVDPMRKDCTLKFKRYAGVGVCFMLLMALRKVLKDTGYFNSGDYPNLKQYLDLVAIGTVADIVPLVEENRVFVKYGIKLIKGAFNRGINALIERTDLNLSLISSWDIAFRIAPRINAAGRVDHADTALRLLLAEQEEEAKQIADRLEKLNYKRQSVEEDILKDAEEIIESAIINESPVVFLAGEGWNPGVIGIVASRVVEKTGKPCVIIGIDKDIGIGSCRSPEGYNILETLNSCREYLKSFGGHSQAAGFKIDPINIEEFRLSLLERARGVKHKGEEFLSVDGYISPEEINFNTFRLFKHFEPYGEGNPRIQLLLEGAKLLRKTIVKEKHVKFLFELPTEKIEGIAFNSVDKFSKVSEGCFYNIVFSPDIDEWNGKEKPFLKVSKLVKNSF